MAKHDVKFTVPQRPLGRADVEFFINRDGDRLGRLKISNGAVVWVPKNRTKGFNLRWDKFADLMREYGTPEK